MPSAILVPPTSDERIQVSSGPYRTVRSASHTFSRQREGRDQAIDDGIPACFQSLLSSSIMLIIFFHLLDFYARSFPLGWFSPSPEASPIESFSLLA